MTHPPAAPSLTVGSPADLIAAVPYLLGFHPTDSAVLVALRSSRLVFAARGDLPDTAGGAAPGEAAAVAARMASVVAQQGADAVIILGYGPAARTDPIIPVLREAVADRGLVVVEALRVADGRFSSYLCENPDCCPPEGVPYDLAVSPVSAAATYAGQVALPDRAALADRVAAVEGPAREAMTAAMARARARLGDLLDRAPVTDVLGGRALREAGEAVVTVVLDAAESGSTPADDDLAWLTLLLAHVPVRDFAWQRITGDDWQLDLWSDVVRRAEPALAAAPAGLLAFAAWLAGHGALANVAVDRALAADPDYPMARLLADALAQGLSPELLESTPGRPGGGGWPSAWTRRRTRRTPRRRRTVRR